MIFAALKTGKFVNRGFLNGPVCPVYGFGMLLVIGMQVFLLGSSDNIFTLFAGSFVLTSAIEFLTGFVLERVFHDKWWDYSDEHFNLMGYVCLRFSILWGLACTFVMKCIHPMISETVSLLPVKAGIVILIVIAVLFCADISMTITTILKLKRRIALIEKITAELKKLSDKIGTGLYDGALIGEKGAERIRSRSGEEAEKLKARLAELKSEKFMGYRRLARAFPQLNLKYDLAEHGKKLVKKIKDQTQDKS